MFKVIDKRDNGIREEMWEAEIVAGKEAVKHESWSKNRGIN